VRSVASTVLTLVMFATYLGIGALAHDAQFSLGWVLASTALVWAGPAQIILISTLGSGATVVQAAIAVTVSAIRLFPMVVSVLPMMRTPRTKPRHLVLATHFIAVTLWVECFRLLPAMPRERRIAFTHGLGTGLVSVCLVANAIGYSIAANLPQLFAAAILLLTPGISARPRATAGSSPDILALVLGLALSARGHLAHRRRYSDQWHCRPVPSPMAFTGGGRANERFLGDWHSLLVLVIAGFRPMKSGGCWACGSAAVSTRVPNSWSG
jgi:hypothetical protein